MTGNIVHASLFSGVGGAEIAAGWMGWRNAFHCETSPFCRRALEKPHSYNLQNKDNHGKRNNKGLQGL